MIEAITDGNNQMLTRRLIDRKTGVVRQISELFRNADQPRLRYMVAGISDTSRFCDNQNDFGSTGVAERKAVAYWAALGEGIERYCAVLSDIHPQKMASFNQLTKEGFQALSPEEFCLFSDDQYCAAGFPYRKPEKSLPLCWIEGKTLLDHEGCYLPSALVFNGYRLCEGEAKISPNIHPGMACGVNLDETFLAALCEIIERDAMMIWWLNRLPMPAIKDPLQEKWQKIMGQNFVNRQDGSIEISFIWLRSDVELPVVFCLLVDKTANVVSGGCAARLNPQQALFKSFCEAVQSWFLAIDIKRGKKGNIAQFVKMGLLPEELMAPVGGELPGTHIIHNLKAYMSPDRWEALESIRQPHDRVRLGDLLCLDTGSPEGNLRAVIDLLRQRGLNPIVVDLTTPDIAEAGLWVVRIFVSGMVPNTPTAYPPLGLKRLHDVPEHLGFESKGKTHLWNLAPLPYS